MNVLVGCTGFVGSNIYANAQGKIDRVFHSTDIEEAYGLKPDLLIYAGLRAEKYLANNAPEKDMELIYQAQQNIQKIEPKRLVLISTIDVLKKPLHVDEEAEIDMDGLQAYGLNRYKLECWVRQNYPDAIIIRLPGLFGKNLKKNFIYDFKNVIPFMLKKEKFEELVELDRKYNNPLLEQSYYLQENGFFKCMDLEETQKAALRNRFKELGFTALHFTDSRSVYQFYPLDRLWNDIQLALKEDIRLWHPATEPVSAAEVYKYLTGEHFVNELSGIPAKYDYWTKYVEVFGGKGKYILSKEEILKQIADFLQ